MGGIGSGKRSWKKTTVEECLTLSMKGLPQKGLLRDGAVGSITWSWPNGDTSKVGVRCIGPRATA